VDGVRRVAPRREDVAGGSDEAPRAGVDLADLLFAASSGATHLPDSTLP